MNERQEHVALSRSTAQALVQTEAILDDRLASAHSEFQIAIGDLLQKAERLGALNGSDILLALHRLGEMELRKRARIIRDEYRSTLSAHDTAVADLDLQDFVRCAGERFEKEASLIDNTARRAARRDLLRPLDRPRVLRRLAAEIERTAVELLGIAGPLEISIDDIDSFSKVRSVDPNDILCLLEARPRLLEDDVQKAIEEILAVPNHKLDSPDEDNDLFSTNLRVDGRRYPSAFLLKGRGTRSRELRVRDCGKNGDQLVRLFQSPAELFVVQYVGQIGESVRKDGRGKVSTKRAEGVRARCCFIDGQDTLRLLSAYELVPKGAR